MAEAAVLDSHVHFWDPDVLGYPWLAGAPGLRRAFLPADYAAAAAAVPVERLVFVEANPRADQADDEVTLVEGLAAADPRIGGIVAFADLLDAATLAPLLDRYEGSTLVKGVRHNIQGHPPGFCLQTAFVAGVREAGRRGLTFDLCATHDQLEDVVELARLCPGTALVLDHCGKPAIRERRLDPWRAHVTRLAQLDHVRCKLSGLLTEADERTRGDADLAPYAGHVCDAFGVDRVLYGSDWPVLTLAGDLDGWYQFTRRFTVAWSPGERRRFYHDNAAEFYGLPPSGSRLPASAPAG